MGTVFSRITGSSNRATAAPRTVERAEYHRNHPGLHNTSTRRVESEISRNVRSPDPEDKQTIQVKNVELNIKNNTESHHTDEFDITNAKLPQKAVLVVRRGQPFDLDVEFDREYDVTKDDLRIVFELGKTPSSSRGTHVEFILSAEDVLNDWGGLIKKKDGNTLQLQIMTPPTISIGKWTLGIDIVKRADEKVIVYRFKEENPIYILFNPWCKDDQVYMSDTKLLNEYILNEIGHIYAGSYKKISPKPWIFGQFQGNVLDCCLYLLDKTKLKDYVKNDPVKISRNMSAMVNSADDNGVLVGNWSGEYDGGKSPLSWTGSAAILEQYYKKKAPVKYGQCWVFSGVLTAVCRTLGIPARSVTNFASAHDCDGSITIDICFDPDHNPIEMLNDDSVWNFHVWNDVWMARPDLAAGYGGWQAIDATPQETSDGIYCMGPTSLLAIKKGEVDMPIDGRFAFAEVNADVVYWICNFDTFEVTRARTAKHRVGKCVSTNRPFTKFSWKDYLDEKDLLREDITDQYKFPEESVEERIAVRKANLHSKSIMPEAYGATAEDVDFDLILNDGTYMGDEIKVNLKIKNNSSETRTVNGRITIASVYYTGVHFKDVDKKEIEKCEIKPNSEETVSVVIPVTEYMNKSMDHCFFKVSCMTIVKETKQLFVHSDELRLRKPHLAIKAPDTATVDKAFSIEVSFVNPLPQTLTNCEVVVDGPGLQSPKTYRQPNVEAKKTYVGNFELKPFKAGKRDVVVYFNCTQIMSVNVSHEIQVSK